MIEKGSATELYIGPSIHTVTLHSDNQSDDNKKYLTQPQSCGGNHDRCIVGRYCLGSMDTCSGVCDTSCFKCSGSQTNNCEQCHPYFYKGYLGPFSDSNSGTCGGSN
jgi:hypothetical protein